MRFRRHRAFATVVKKAVLVRDPRGWSYYEGDDVGDVPEGAVVVPWMSPNWDGGPPLIERVVIVEEPVELARERAAQVVRLVDAIARALRPWGVAEVATCTWVVGEDARAVALASRRDGDVVRELRAMVHEVASDHGLGERRAGGIGGLRLSAREWARMAAKRVRLPDEIGDPHTAFGPSGPPTVPAPWRERLVAEIDDPYPALIAAAEAGLAVEAITRDEIVLR